MAPVAGADLVVEGNVVGTLTSASYSAQLAAPIGLAYVGRNTDVGTAVTVEGQGGAVTGELRELPLISG